MALVFLFSSIADTFTCISKWLLLERGWLVAVQFLVKEGSGFGEKNTMFSKLASDFVPSLALVKSLLKPPSGFPSSELE